VSPEEKLVAYAGVILTLGPLVVSAFVYLSQRHRELQYKKFELYHDLIRRLVEPDQPDARMRVSRQMAAAFELRNFPEYAEVSARILAGLLEFWLPDKPEHRRLKEELGKTIEYLNTKIKREDRVSGPGSSVSTDKKAG
jgi:hypothetical protein